MDNKQRNSYVKKQITHALLELLKKQELKDIAVSEITNTAQVSRISFYRNYVDKESVVKEYIWQTLQEWNNSHPKTTEQSEDEILGDMFAYITE